MQAQPNVPYQAYKPKRHIRNVSAQNQAQNQTALSGTASHAARPASVYSQVNGNGFAHGHNLSEPVVPLQRDFSIASEKELNGKDVNGALGLRVGLVLDDSRRTVSMTDVIPTYEAHRKSPPPPTAVPPQTSVIVPVNSPPEDAASSTTGSPSSSERSTPLSTSPSRPPSAVPPPVITAEPTVKQEEAVPDKLSITPVAGPSTAPSAVSPAQSNESSPTASPRPALTSLSSSRKGSTFKRIPLRPASSRPSVPSSPLRPQSTHTRTASGLSTTSRVLNPTPARTPETAPRLTSPLVAPTPIASDRALPPLPTLELPGPSASQAGPAYRPYTPAGHHILPARSSSLASPVQASPTAASPPNSIFSGPAVSPAPSSSSTPVALRASTPGSRSRTPAPYRPGFQPKGVYRPRTDEFLEARKNRGDADRVERTRLERRLEKLINLHFPHPDQKAKEQLSARPAPAVNRRASSFFDIDIASLKGKGPGDLWKGVVQSQAAGGKTDIRAAEQTITPWEDDASVSQCPLCAASFHPLTNRKHHCRLCGRIICSLAPKMPQRPQPCSLLFVADPLTGQIEEVVEGVDYGVRKRTNSVSKKGKGREDALGLSEDEKFLRGVRICRDCRPILLRRQYMHEAHTVPLFTRLYEAFISIEKEIEETLPQFQELMMSLNNEERPSPEASAARKRILEAFAQYDALAKRIRKLPCKGGQGSSQDRVQQAIITRANLFLQKNMLPLQAFPKPNKTSATASPAAESPAAEHPAVDPDSEVARVLQPLLEQEALLESFVEEAKAQRKFEDAQTLKRNLNEIRAEIDRILANADGGLRETRPASAGRNKTR